MAAVPELDTDAGRERAAAYVAELRALDAEVAATLAAIPDERRVLVTNHDVFGYFADRYGFEVLGVVIPGGSTLAQPSRSEEHTSELQTLMHISYAVFRFTQK